MTNGFLYAVTVLIWGTTWFAIIFQLGVVAPEVSIVWRFLTASLTLIAWCLVTGRSLGFRSTGIYGWRCRAASCSPAIT